MKTILRLLFTLGLLLSIPFNALAFNYYITFTGSGASSTVDSVVAQNLFKGTQVTVPAGTDLRLYDVETSVNELNTIVDFAGVYPNPMNGNATFSFVAKNEGNARIAVYGIDGQKVTGIDLNLDEGKNSFDLKLPKGVYLVQATGNGYTYTTKTISLAMAVSEPAISFTGNVTESKPQKVTSPVVKLQYTPGDQILYKGYSGNFCTIVPDKPGDSKTTDFKFVGCTDADGNHYAVIHIGNQTWMAESLNTTKFRNGEAITEQWAYNNDDNNAVKYGRLYSWNAVVDSRNIAPTGWHVPSDGEWTTLENYLIANGYNYDGTITGNKIAKSLAAITEWTSSNINGTVGKDLSKNNKSGFSALPVGYRDNSGTFLSVRDDVNWWTSTFDINNDCWSRNLNFLSSDLYRVVYSKSYAFSVRCVLNDLTTEEVTNIEISSAQSGGNILNTGSLEIIERGVCWSRNQSPTITDRRTVDGAGNGSFTSNITGLIPNATYFVRAYAISNERTFYGNEVKFTTKHAEYNSETVTDIDGNVYKTITIGTQTWMAENLKTTRYRNGERIGTTTPANKDISAESEPKYQWAYNGDENYVAKFGRLYTWYAVNDYRNIAPVGWHVPSDAEWKTLIRYLIANGYNYDGTTIDNKIAKSLAAISTDWIVSNKTGMIGNDLNKNNSSGFTAFPSGLRTNNSVFGYLGMDAIWWTSSNFSSDKAYCLDLAWDESYLVSGQINKIHGFSVRCVKDVELINNEAVLIPSGTFIMGSPETEVDRVSDETQYEVTLTAFRMSQYEITNAQYAAFLNAKGIGIDGIYATGSYPTQALIYRSDYGVNYSGDRWVPVMGLENHPVIDVTWYGATEYATYVGGSLPTEAQWEYACRAGTTTPFNTGSCLTNLQANYDWGKPYSTCTNTVLSEPNMTQAVGSYPPNGYGLYDMHGNVSEWCSDWYSEYPVTPQSNPTGAASGSNRVLRGNYYGASAKICRSAYRCNDYQDRTSYKMGFRVVFVP